MESFPVDDPLICWVVSVDRLPELAQCAVELMHCPAAGVLSEWAFSVARGFVTNNRACQMWGRFGTLYEASNQGDSTTDMSGG